VSKLSRLLTVAALPVFGCCAVAVLAEPVEIRLPPETAQLKPSQLPGFVVAAQKCALCHSADYISFQPPGMTKAQWTAEMVKMQHTYGAPIDETEIKLLGIYLAATYGDASTVTAEDRALTLPPVP
jgi:mono/diheme cytochrome c family protein